MDCRCTAKKFKRPIDKSYGLQVHGLQALKCGIELLKRTTG